MSLGGTARDGLAARPTICLSMIVRDEAHIITETLESVAPHIDRWVIVDTGSTDETIEVVRSFFAERALPGAIHERPWRDFGTNRTEALELAAGVADYTWVVDADDLVAGDLDLSGLEADGYSLRFGTGFVFWRTQIFRSSLPWRYEGVLHEYPVCDAQPCRIERLHGEYHMVGRSLGSRSQVDDKYERDVAVLAAARERDPDDPRTVFYLAQSHRDAGQDHEALRHYLQRADMGGWEEEVYVARLEAARCRHRLGADWEEVRQAYLEAWTVRPKRGEALHELARHHRLAGEHALGYLYASAGADLPLPDDELFVSSDVHRWELRDEASICAFYLGHFEQSRDWCRELLAEPHLPDRERARVEANLHFALDALKDDHLEHQPELIRRLASVRADRVAGTAPHASVTLTVTSARRRDLFERTIDSFLSCCTDLGEIDRWICVDDGSDEADRAAMAERYPFFEFVWKDRAGVGHARSMNLLRDLVDTPYWLHLEDDWQFVDRLPYVARARAILDRDPTLGQVLFNRSYAETFDDRTIHGGDVTVEVDGSRVWHQVHLEGAELERHLSSLPPGGGTNAWWAHYSLRPSLLRTEALRALGPYDVDADHFELEFAQRYAAAGLTTAAFDAITCLHTGPLTSDRGPRRRPNAYDLVGATQFTGNDSGDIARVRPLAWWASAAELVARLDRQSVGGGRWGGIELTAGDDPDYWAVLTHPGIPAEPADHLDPNRTVVLRTEPSAGIDQWGIEDPWRAPEARDFLQVRRPDQFGTAAEWHLGQTMAELSAASPVKERDLSAIVSGKDHMEGHRLRISFVHHLQEHGVALDVFGFDNVHGFANHLGPLPPAAKDEGLLPYRYTLAVENCAEPGYVTEKLIDAILSETVAFYWGCPDLEDRLDPQCFIRIPLEDLKASRAIVEAAIASDEWSARIEAVRAEKQRILSELQILPVLDRVVRGHRRLLGTDLRVINLDRRTDRLATFDQRFRAAAGDELADRVRRVPAVDGHDLELTDEIAHLFRGNDHGFRRGIVGCAMSHLEVWRQVVAADRPSIVLEDDVRPLEGFRTLLNELLSLHGDEDPPADIVILGANTYDDERDRASLPVGRPLQLVGFDAENFLGGTYAYLVTPHGARRLLELVERDGLQQAVDWFLRSHAQELGVARCRPDLVEADIAWPGEFGDSDIQHDPATIAAPTTRSRAGPRPPG